MKKRRVSHTPIDDLAVLAKLSQTPEWKTLEKIIRINVRHQEHVIVLMSNDNPTKLAIDKSRVNGLIAGMLLVVKKVETATNEMNKLAEKEVE